MFFLDSGRTGRAGKSGDAYSFVCSADPNKTLRDLVDVLVRAKQEIPPALHELIRSGNSGNRSRGNYGGARPVSYGGGASYARPPAPTYGGGPSYTSTPYYGGAPSAPSSYGSMAQFNQAVLASTYATATVGAKRPRESFSTVDERQYRRDDREVRRSDSRDRRRSSSRDRRRRSDSRDRRTDRYDDRTSRYDDRPRLDERTRSDDRPRYDDRTRSRSDDRARYDDRR